MHYGTLYAMPDTLLCDVPIVEWHYDDQDRLVSGEPYPCGMEVMVVWSFAVPVVRGEPTFPEDVPKAAVSSSWQMECGNGHVHGMSGNQFTTDDNAEQFDPTVVGPTGGSNGTS